MKYKNKLNGMQIDSPKKSKEVINSYSIKEK